MQIVYHIGAHCTDEGQLRRCLMRNRVALGEQGVIVANPGRFRPIFRETLAVLQGDAANAEVQEVMLDSILTEDNPQRIIFSNDAFLCGIPRILDHGRLYPDAGRRCRALHGLFHDQEVEFWLGIRNPATFLPAAYAKSDADSFAAFLGQTDPATLRWSSIVEDIHATLPGIPLKVWSNEDTPFIWRELVREIADHQGNKPMIGLDDYLGAIMKPEGLERMASYLKTHPPANEMQRRRILSAFLDKFEIDDPTQEVSLPGWTTEYTDMLTDTYEEDLFTIERMPGVQFISP